MIRFATFLAPIVRPTYEFIASTVGRILDQPVSFEEGRSFEQFEAGEVDVAFICSLPYVLLRRRPDPPVEPIAAPVLEGSRYEDKPVYYSDVIVRSDSPLHSFADLRGWSWSFNEPFSHSGYNVVRHHLIQQGETAGFFGRVVEAGWHQRSIEMVRQGDVDASAIDSQVLDIASARDPSLMRDLRVIESIGPSTIQPVVAATRLDEQLKASLRRVFTELAADESSRARLGESLFSRFVPATDADYDDIRKMLEGAEAATFMEIR